MPQDNSKLKVRIVMSPTPALPEEDVSGSDYRWDRILTALGVVLVIIALLGWWLNAPTPEPQPATRPAAGVDNTGGGERKRQSSVSSPSPPTADETAAGAASPGPESAAQAPAPQASAIASDSARDAPPAAGNPDTRATENARLETPAVIAREAAPRSPANAALESRDSPETDQPGTAPGDSLAAAPLERSAEVSQVAPEASARAGSLVPGVSNILAAEVARFTLTNALRAREPVGSITAIDTAPTGNRAFAVYAFADVRNLAGDTIYYRWLHEGRQVARVRVDIGSDHWRSSSSKLLNKHMRGDWRVELTAGDGRLLAFAEFVY